MARNTARQQNTEELLDCITLGGKHSIMVPQEDGNWPPFASVQASNTVNRDPSRHLVSDDRLLRMAAQPQVREQVPGYKWCSNCGDLVKAEGFSLDPHSRDGRHTICKTCRNEQARRWYALRKSQSDR